MSELYHHGILGMKWGVRRTPEQLGHTTGAKESTAGMAAKTKTTSSSKNVHAMSDDELRQRISRLQMEENYANLLAREKTRNTGPVKKAMAKAFHDLGDRAVGIGVEAAANALRKKVSGDKFDVKDWLDKDVSKMDEQTMKRVKDWYTTANILEKQRAERQKTGKPNKGRSS